MTHPIFQRRYAFTVGDGPGTCARVGCVLCSCCVILRDLGVAPNITPDVFNTIAKASHGFIGDALDVPRALSSFPVTVEDKHSAGLSYERARIMASGGRMLVRVAFDETSKDGHHTIAAMAIGRDGTLTCLDSAIGSVTIDPDLRASVMWRKVPKTYRVVNLRGIFKAR